MSPSIFSDLVGDQELLSVLYIFDCNLEVEFIKNVCSICFNRKFPIKELFVHTTNAFYSFTGVLLSMLSSHCNTSTVLVTRDTFVCQTPTSEQILLALRLEPAITIWKFCSSFLSTETFYLIVSHLTSKASKLAEINILSGDLGECELEILNNHLKEKQVELGLKVLSLSCSVTDKAAIALSSILSLAKKLEVIDLLLNNLQQEGVIKISNALVQSKCSLKSFNINLSNITNKAAIHIGALLSHKTSLNTFRFSGNCLQTKGTVEILKNMNSISHIENFCFINNQITTLEAHYLAIVLSNNTMLKELNLSSNCLQTEGVIETFECMQHIFTLKRLFICDNNISKEAAESISIFLSNNVQLEQVDLNNNSLKELGALKLLRIARDLSNLRNFEVCHNSIENQAADNIVTLFDPNSEEKTLYSRSSILKTKNKLGIISAVEKSSNLATVAVVHNFDHNHHATSGMAVILSCDVALDTSSDALQIVDIIKSLRSIEQLSKLSKIHITHSQISDQGAVDLAIVLSRNNYLEELVLSHDNLGTTKTNFKE